MLLALLLSLAQVQFAIAQIVNTVTVNASGPSGQVSATDTVSVTVDPNAPSVLLAKSGTLNDDDGTPGFSAGDTITYVVTAENTGNTGLTNVAVNDPLVTLVFDPASDPNNDGILNPGETWRWTANYPVTQADIDTNGGGDGDIDNTVTLSTAEMPDRIASAETPIGAAAPAMLVAKTGVLNDDDGIPGISAGDTITYTVTVENTGNVSLTNIVPDDPLVALTLTGGDDGNLVLDPGETWTYTGNYALTQTDIDGNGDGDGAIENIVRVASDQLSGPEADATVPLGINPSMQLVKEGILTDDDGKPGLTAGDTIQYTVIATNTGNIRLTNPVFNDPLVTLTLQSGDLNNDGILDVGEAWTLTGTLILTQGDLDSLGGGDGEIENIVTVSTDQLPDQSAEDRVPIAPVADLRVAKTASEPVRLFPTIYEIEYQISVSNNGALTQTNIRLQEDLAGTLAPATMIGAPIVTVSGFSGPGGYNTGFDGIGDIELLSGDVQLAPGDMAVVTIRMTIDTGSQSVDSLNTVLASSDQIPGPVPSDDPDVTPGDPNDRNPTPLAVPDPDGDGSPNGDEDGSSDRDGDGVPDNADYDPTGYFYCQADGRILSGGLISVTNIATGGTQTGIGSSNGVTIIRDGSDGQYQFHATQAGNFRLSYILPPGGIASTTRLTGGNLDVSSLLPDNPAVLGSGQYGLTGFLADFTAGANPFYTEFSIEAGDPAVFNNNIPLQHCGTPSVIADKSVESGPDLQPGGESLITYRLTATADGNETVENVQLVDNLATVFGAANFSVVSAVIDSAPPSFGASIDPFFDGVSNLALLTTNGRLQPGESVTVLLTVAVTAPAGLYENTLLVRGTSPFDGSAIPPATDNAEVEIDDPSDSGLIVEKSALPGQAPIGGIIEYTITIRNPTDADILADIVDLIPNGMTYVDGSARVDGVPLEPELAAATRLKPPHQTILDHDEIPPASGRELVWRGITIPAGGSITITLRMVINASATGREFVNLAFGREPGSDIIITNVAKAKVLLEIEPVFQCSDLIGRVFEDRNRNGYMDDGEAGMPGVRLATANGLLINTDSFGRYHIACGAIPDGQIGSNFILKLDPRTLPAGYEMTTENPRVVRLTRGKLAKLNFGVVGPERINLVLTAESFEGSGTKLTVSALRSIGAVLPKLEAGPHVLRIVYRGNEENGKARARAVETLVKRAWEAGTRPRELMTETLVTKQ